MRGAGMGQGDSGELGMAPSMVWHPSRQTPAAGQGPLDRLWRGGLTLGDGGVYGLYGEGVSQAEEGKLSELSAPKIRTFPFLVEAHFKHKP